MTDTTTGPNAPLRKRSLLRPALWTAGVVIVIGAIGFFAVPPVARHYAVKILGETLGRPVSIEGVALNPFTATAEVRGLKILSADAGSEALAFDALRVNAEPVQSLIQRGVVLHEVALRGPRLEIGIDEGGRHSWSDVAERIEAMLADKEEPADDESGALFSIGNIRISGGHVRVDDKPRGLVHEVADLEVGLPFISNLPVKVDVFVEPSLSATLDGNPLLMKARLKPFADSHDTILDVVLDKFDLTPWLVYAPFDPAFSLPSAQLSSNIELSFRQAPEGTPELALSGPLKLEAFQLLDKDGTTVANIPEFELEFADVQPLIKRWHFTRLRLAQPEIDLVRLEDGGINLMKLLPATAEQAAEAKPNGNKQQKGKKEEAKAAGEPAADAAPGAAAAEKPDFLLAHARIRDGVVRFEDRSLKQPFKTRIEAINLDLRDLATDSDMPAEIRLDYVSDAGEKLVHEDRLRLEPFEFDGLLNFESIQAPRYAPYLAEALPGGELRSGTLSGALRYKLALDDKGEPRIDLKADTLVVRDFALALKGAKDAALKVPELDATEAVLDLDAQSVKLATLGIKGASVSAVRLKNGDIDLLGITGPAAKSGSKPAAQKGAKAKGGKPAAEAPWVVAVDKFALQAASIRVEDRTVNKPVVLAVDNIGLEVDGFSTAKDALSQLKLDSRINRNGRLGVTGSLGLEPLKADLRIDARSLDLLPVQPYVLEQTKISISRGALNTQGRLRLDTGRRGDLRANFRGDLSVGNFASVDRLNATDFVRWRTLRIGGINATSEPFSLAVQRIALDDFQTRLILDEQGRLNLREIQGEQAGGGEAAAAAQPPPTPPSALDPFIDPALANTGPRQVEGQRSVELPPAPAEPPPPIRIDRIEIKRGNIAFSDRFIQPHYDVNLTDMAGELTGLSTDPDTLAKLDLKGRVDKAAPVEVAGELNPFRHDAHLDILASVKDFELTGLSSYAGKYVGYGIAKGKLSAELNYRIEERKLTATNQIFLDQLTFGDKVDSPDAMNLPVQLAVSLLQNSRGEIDLHLPVSGTLDDPEFSVFGLVIKVLVNLIGKAITSPFALLGSVLGGGEELSYLELAPGAVEPGEAEHEKLGTLATALLDRPALRLDITGRADPAVDTDGLKQAALQRAVKAQKLKALVDKGEAAPSLDDIEVGAEEYPELLKKAYREGDFDKPRNFIGMAKDVPVPEMEALILANTPVGDNELRALAQQRAQAVRDWLAGEGGVPGERIFVLEPKVEAAGENGQVQFSLR
ncbi:DUF748 domain-containing protein [Thauera sp. SDU_THAU2]|uniref:DUF748 domain-containing protein n=1 Tax=Thauera sp. SDU_THAU2 TaxID=3136633 RepID=UPI00311EE8A9